MWTSGLMIAFFIIAIVGVIIEILFLYLSQNHSEDICEIFCAIGIGCSCFGIIFLLILSIVCGVRGKSTSYKDYVVEKIQIEDKPLGHSINTEKGIKVFYTYKGITDYCYIKDYEDIIRDENIKINYLRDYDNVFTDGELHLVPELYDAYIDIFQEKNKENTIFEKDKGIIEQDLSEGKNIYNIDNIENVETIIVTD